MSSVTQVNLQAVFPLQYKNILSLAMFLILQPQSSVCSYESFANCTYLPAEHGLNPTAITRLFQSITDEQRFAYLKRRAAHSQTLVDGGIGHLTPHQSLRFPKPSVRLNTARTRKKTPCLNSTSPCCSMESVANRFSTKFWTAHSTTVAC